MAPGVVAHSAALLLRHPVEVPEHLVDVGVREVGALERRVRVVDVGLVVLVVVQAHRRLVDRWLERRVVVRKVRDREGHPLCTSLS